MVRFMKLQNIEIRKRLEERGFALPLKPPTANT